MSEIVDGPATTLERISSGIAGLDEVLGGGFSANRFHLIEGDPGTGKTTLALHFLLEGRRGGERVLYVTLSETAEELHAVARSHGWTLDGVDLHELAPNEQALRLDEQYTILHPSEVELGETTWAVLEQVERSRPSRVVFDSLSEIRLLARDPLRYRRQILGLKQFFAGRDCTVLLDDLSSHEQGLESISHGVIMLEQLAPEFGGERRRLRVVKHRGIRYRGGYHDFVITTGGLRVFPRLVAAEYPAGFRPGQVSSGLDSLDQLLGGGLDRGTSTLLIGPAGAGKSVICTQYAVAAAARGERTAMYVFDEGLHSLVSRSEGLGLPLRSHLASGHIQIRQLDPAALSPGQFDSLVREAVQEQGCRVVVIDSLNGYLNAMVEEHHLLVQLHELFSYLNQRGTLTLLTMAQHGLLGERIESPVDISYLADTVLLLRYFEADGRLRQSISVVKKRTGAHERTIRELRIGPGIRVGPPLAEFHGVLTGRPTFVGPKRELLANAED